MPANTTNFKCLELRFAHPSPLTHWHLRRRCGFY
jgi:hypothetical protein